MSSPIAKLKIKLKALAAESRIIRQQERKMKGKRWGPEMHDLREHRIHVVRAHSRNTHLAYGLLRGFTLRQIENTSRTEPDWDAIHTMVKKYGEYPFYAENARKLYHWENEMKEAIHFRKNNITHRKRSAVAAA